MKKNSIFLLLIVMAIPLMAQQVINSRKVSTGVINIMNRAKLADKPLIGQPRHEKRFLALLTFNDNGQDADMLRSYDCRVVDHIGRIYIVEIPVSRVAELSNDERIERIEAERMPRPAMDVTPGQVDAAPVYQGTDLPHAFTGKGVAAGVFDIAFDFTHPSFLDSDGNTRVKYYYDFLWPNEDGTRGHALEIPDEIVAYGHSQHTNSHTHGTHVLGTMAGSAVNGKFQGMAPESDIYLADFNSYRSDFENPDELTSAVAVLGFKYIFDRAERDGKPCVINLSSCESITLSRQRILEGEALHELVGPGRIIVAAAGNFGKNAAHMHKEATDPVAGVGIINGVGGGGLIDMDIVTPVNQQVRYDFLGMQLMGGGIEGTLIFNTDSIDSLMGDTCHLSVNVSMGTVKMHIYRSDYQDPRGKVYHVVGELPNMGYLLLCGATCLLRSDALAWLYTDVLYCPFVNVSGVPQYSHTNRDYTVCWPAVLDCVVAVGATGYKSTFVNIDGSINTSMESFAPDQNGHITQFSSRGPTFDGTVKPDVVARGMNIKAAYNSFYNNFEGERANLTDKVTYNGKDYYFMAQSGTSMVSPVVAGAVALWLEANPSLTPQDVLDVIAQTSTHPEQGMSYPNNIYGNGQIDVYRGLLYVLEMTDIPELSLYQPAEAHFQVSGTQLIVDRNESSTAIVTVYSTSGDQVLTTSINGEHSVIDLSSLPSGIYAVQLTTGSVSTTGSTLIRL